MKFLLAFSLMLPLLAEDAQVGKSAPVPAIADENGALKTTKPPTVEELTAQVAVKDQEIAALKRQATEMQRDVSIYRQSFNACVDQIQAGQQSPLNSAQRQMMRQKPAPKDKP